MNYYNGINKDIIIMKINKKKVIKIYYFKLKIIILFKLLIKNY